MLENEVNPFAFGIAYGSDDEVGYAGFKSLHNLKVKGCARGVVEQIPCAEEELMRPFFEFCHLVGDATLLVTVVDCRVIVIEYIRL